jgi:spore maturation protein SpmA/spore maturation protein SpmB
MNIIFLGMVVTAFGVAAIRELFSSPGTMQALSAQTLGAANQSVQLALGLVGAMALFLGLMKVAEKGGLLTILARLMRPLLVRLFPSVPADHPAMGAMILNLSANALGLGNAATPFGIRAMQHLDCLNLNKGTATKAMILFLAVNTSSVTLLPTGVIALRASLGSANPAGILPTTLFASLCSTVVAVVLAKCCERFFPERSSQEASLSDAHNSGDGEKRDRLEEVEIYKNYPLWASLLVLFLLGAFIGLAVLYGQTIAPWIIPGLVVSLLGFGAYRGVQTYEAFVEGAKEGFDVALKIIPYLVAILVAVAMLRTSGALGLVVTPLAAWTAPLGLPGEAIPMALLRPLSGSGAYGVMASILADPAIGPDSYTGYLVSTLQGSSETTFYVLAVYFGAVGIRRIRYTLIAALGADLAGIVGAVIACRYLYG